MKKFITKFMLLLPSFMLLASSFSGISYAAAATTGACGSATGSPADQVLQGVSQSGSVDCTGTGVTNIVQAVVTILSYIVGIASIIMILLAGFKYVTAGGDSNKVSSAKSTLIYALVGLVIAALAQFLVHAVLNTAVAAG
jgi:hypothetical protein